MFNSFKNYAKNLLQIAFPIILGNVGFIMIDVGDVIVAGMYSDERIDNVASFYQITNAVGKANYIQMPSISGKIRSSDESSTSYTIEMFYRTRNTVRGTDGNRQVLFKFGGYPWAMIMFKATSANLFYSYLLNGENKYYTSSASNVDDQKWHHIAVVVDGTEGSISFYVDYVLDHKATGTLPEIVHGNSLFVGSKQNGEGQWYDGWIDDIRVMRRALAPSEFLTTRPVGTGDASLLALFENNYAFTCSSNETFSVSGRGEAREGGTEPTFVKDSRGDLLLDGTNGVIRVANQHSVS